MIYFIIILYFLPLFLIKPFALKQKSFKNKFVGFSMFSIGYFFLIFYYIPAVINSSSNLGILEILIQFVRKQQQSIDYLRFYPIVLQLTSTSLIFFILGYLTPLKIKNIYFYNYQNNLSKTLLISSIILFIIQCISIASFGLNYFSGYLTPPNSETFTSALQLSIVSAEIIGVLNALNLSLKKTNKPQILVYLFSMFLLTFRAKRLELFIVFLPSYLALQKRNLSNIKNIIKLLPAILIVVFIIGFIGIFRLNLSDFGIDQILFSILSEPFLATQSLQGYLTINNGEPRYLLINTFASFLSVIPSIIFPNKWEFLFSAGYYNNKDLNINGANIILTGLFDDFGIIGIIIFSFLLGCFIRYSDRSRILNNRISYYSNNLNLQTIFYYLSPVVILHFRDGFTNTLKYLIQSSILVILTILISSKFKLLIYKK